MYRALYPLNANTKKKNIVIPFRKNTVFFYL